MKMIKTYKNILSILFILAILLNSVTIPKAIAYSELFIDETTDRPNRIECSVRLNPETKVVANYNGKDAFTVGDEIKLDIYVETTHINLNTFSIGVGLSSSAFDYVKYELGEEIPDEYKTKFTKQPTYNKFIDYSSGKADYSPRGVIIGYDDSKKCLNNSKPFKILTATFKVTSAYMDMTTFKDYIKNVKPTTAYTTNRMDDDIATRSPILDFDIYDFYVMSEPNQVLMRGYNARMKINEYTILTAKVNPETAYQGVIWSSSAPEVLSVNQDGVITALKEGEATITAQSVAKPTQKDYYTIKVQGVSDNILIDSVSISNKKEINDLLPGYSRKVGTSILPENTTEDTTITYSSSNPEVATINDQGILRTLYPGTTTITVKTVNSKIDEYTITVKNPVSKVKINNKTAGIYLYDYTGYFLDIETEPKGYEDLIKIKSSNENKVVVNNTYKSIRALDVGDVKITASIGEVNDNFIVSAFSKEIPAKSVTINNKKEEMSLGEELKLDVTVNPNPETNAVSALKYKVDNIEIATINQYGVLKAKKPGTVKVTAYSATTEDSFTVKIIDESGITDVEILNFNGKIKEYTLASYEIKITPDDAVGISYLEFSSSNTDVVEVYKDRDDEIEIEGISKGDAEIIIKAGESFEKRIPVKVIDLNSVEEYQKGDINGNGVVDLTDYSMILRHVKGIKLLTGEEKERADVNGSGVIDLTDYSMVLRHVKGIKKLE